MILHTMGGGRKEITVDMLHRMLEAMRLQVEAREKEIPLEEMKRRVRLAPSARDGLAVFKQGPGAVKLIGEIKRKSPSQGDIGSISNPEKLAQSYEAGGAAAISVFTEETYYGGRPDDLLRVRGAVDIPVICKNYVISPYQVHEYRAGGADMVVLAVGSLSEAALEFLIERTKSLGMCPIVEAHSRLEGLRAVEAGAEVIAVNSRNPHTQETNKDTFAQIVDVIPEGVVAIAESGVKGPHDVFEYAQDGADAVLVGQALIQSSNPQSLMSDMVAAGCHPALAADRKKRIRPHYNRIRAD